MYMEMYTESSRLFFASMIIYARRVPLQESGGRFHDGATTLRLEPLFGKKNHLRRSKGECSLWL